MALWTQADVDALKAAVKTGALKVKFADREVTYQSLDQMRSLLAEMVAAVASTAGQQPYTVATHNKGFER
jgi:hypothetical protein